MLSEDRKQIFKKIQEYERLEFWDKDVENDPKNIQLTPDKADYLYEKPFAKLLNKLANKLAVKYYEGEIKKGNLIIKNVFGLENLRSVKSGAILTCNHFSVNDNYALYRAIKSKIPKGKYLYKVIKEGNYTSSKGIFGFFFRHCNTLPLSTNLQTMKKFYSALEHLLKNGEKILVYPEQAMWWNYRKPRPMKNGAFRFAVKNNVPVVPCFITMEDTDKLDKDGAPVQAYTIWILPAIYPDLSLSERGSAEKMKEYNYKVWKEVYEKFYNTKLTYLE